MNWVTVFMKLDLSDQYFTNVPSIGRVLVEGRGYMLSNDRVISRVIRCAKDGYRMSLISAKQGSHYLPPTLIEGFAAEVWDKRQQEVI